MSIQLYKNLKDQMKIGREQESILVFENAKKDLVTLKSRQKDCIEKEIIDQKVLIESKVKVTEAENKLKVLQSEVKALGEDKLIKIQGNIAGLETNLRELDRQAIQHKSEGEKLKEKRDNLKMMQLKLKEETLNKSSNNPLTNLPNIL